jgi:hypothetical protein
MENPSEWWLKHDHKHDLAFRPQNKLILCTSRATQSEPTELQDALQVCEPHLDLLALVPRPFEVLGASQRPGNVPGMLMDIARILA